MGHVARLLEESGIPTVIIGIQALQKRLTTMPVPRLVSTPHPKGRTVGAPGDVEGQRATIMAALDLLVNAKQGGTVVELNRPYRP